jgi:hypothetical protein
MAPPVPKIKVVIDKVNPVVPRSHKINKLQFQERPESD